MDDPMAPPAVAPVALRPAGLESRAISEYSEVPSHEPLLALDDPAVAGSIGGLDDDRGQSRLVSKLLVAAALLVFACTAFHRPSYEAAFRQGSQLWVPSGWHKDAEGHDVKDTWDHYQMPNCDPGPEPGTKKKVFLGRHGALRKMKAKLKMKDDVKIEPVRNMKDSLDLTDPEPQLFATDGTDEGRLLRGVPDLKDFLDLAPVRDLEGGKKYGDVQVKWVELKRSRAQKICAEHIAIASADHAGMIKKHQQFEAKRKAIRGLHYWQGTHRCGVQFYNTDFPSKIVWRDQGGVDGPAYCQQRCTWNQDCEAWSWSKWGCFLKKTPKPLKSEPNSTNLTDFRHQFHAGVYSGHPCDRQESPYPWINDELKKHSLPKPKAYHPAKNASMFCTMLILPYSYEVDLAIMQHQYYYSIFMCDLWKVYSSQRLQLAPQLTTHLINTSQVAEAAGQWGTALNTEAFVAYWRALIQDGDYLKAQWLVKVDPDTVWFPDRLVPILQRTEQKHSIQAPGIYLNNCQQGLHGPIEILSQTAFSTLAQVSPKCFWSMNDWGNWQWGEDMWLDICMMRVGHAKRIYVPKMLAEAHCNNWPGWDSCQAKDVVAFHPFKKADQYIQCASTAVSTTVTQTRTATTTATVTTQTKTTTHVDTPVEQVENFFGNIFHH